MSALQPHRMLGSAIASPISVLILDDDSFDRKRIGRWIKSPESGAIQLREAADLMQFATAIEQQKFDLVIIDYCLADGNGLDAMDCLVSSTLNASTYVVMISGRDDETARRNALRHGCDTFFSKSDMSEARLSELVQRVGLEKLGQSAQEKGLPAIQHWAKRARRRRVRETGHDGTATLEIAQSPLLMTPRLVYSAELESSFDACMQGFCDEDEFVFDPSQQV